MNRMGWVPYEVSLRWYKFWALGGWLTRLKWFGAIILGSLSAGILLMNAHGIFQSQINPGNPLFRSLPGWSLPVIVVNVIVLLALWFLWKWATKKNQACE
jgi:hypothetical protein